MSCPRGFSSRKGATRELTGQSVCSGQAAHERASLLAQKRRQMALKKLPRRAEPLAASISNGVVTRALNQRCVVLKDAACENGCIGTSLRNTLIPAIAARRAELPVRQNNMTQDSISVQGNFCAIVDIGFRESHGWPAII